ncbi:MAG: hypothetical protein IT457_19805 [Planctomycetes bacterium]|nr:hypothetical protein [Planctomycetota bacterium]
MIDLHWRDRWRATALAALVAVSLLCWLLMNTRVDLPPRMIASVVPNAGPIEEPNGSQLAVRTGETSVEPRGALDGLTKLELVGVVRRNEGQVPVAGAEVEASFTGRDRRPAGHVRGASDGQGLFALDLEFADWPTEIVVRVSARGCALQERVVRIARREPRLDAGTFTLEAGAAVRGIVVEGNANGKGIAGVDVHFVCHQAPGANCDPHYDTVRTDDRGVFWLAPLPIACRYSARASLGGTNLIVISPRRGEVLLSGEECEVVMVVAPLSRLLAGRVLDELTGEQVSGGSLSWRQVSTTDVAVASVGNTGDFELHLPEDPASWQTELRHPTHFLPDAPSLESVVEARGLILARRSPGRQLRVRSEGNGTVLREWSYRMLQGAHGFGVLNEPPPAKAAQVAEDGVALIALPASDCLLRVEAPGHAATFVALDGKDSLRGIEEIRLWPLAERALRIEDEGGLTVPGCTVMLLAAIGRGPITSVARIISGSHCPPALVLEKGGVSAGPPLALRLGLAQSDAAGSVLMPMPVGGPYAVRVERQGFRTMISELAELEPDGAQFVVRLGRSRATEGRVVPESAVLSLWAPLDEARLHGTPLDPLLYAPALRVAGSQVGAVPLPMGSETRPTIERDGTFRNPAEPGDWDVMQIAAALRTRDGQVSVVSVDVSDLAALGPDGRWTIDLTERAPRTVRGRLLTSFHASQWARLSFEGSHGIIGRMWAAVDVASDFEVELFPGRYRVALELRDGTRVAVSDEVLIPAGRGDHWVGLLTPVVPTRVRIVAPDGVDLAVLIGAIDLGTGRQCLKTSGKIALPNFRTCPRSAASSSRFPWAWRLRRWSAPSS